MEFASSPFSIRDSETELEKIQLLTFYNFDKIQEEDGENGKKDLWDAKQVAQETIEREREKKARRSTIELPREKEIHWAEQV